MAKKTNYDDIFDEVERKKKNGGSYTSNYSEVKDFDKWADSQSYEQNARDSLQARKEYEARMDAITTAENNNPIVMQKNAMLQLANERRQALANPLYSGVKNMADYSPKEYEDAVLKITGNKNVPLLQNPFYSYEREQEKKQKEYVDYYNDNKTTYENLNNGNVTSMDDDDYNYVYDLLLKGGNRDQALSYLSHRGYKNPENLYDNFYDAVMKKSEADELTKRFKDDYGIDNSKAWTDWQHRPQPSVEFEQAKDKPTTLDEFEAGRKNNYKYATEYIDFWDNLDDGMKDLVLESIGDEEAYHKLKYDYAWTDEKIKNAQNIYKDYKKHQNTISEYEDRDKEWISQPKDVRELWVQYIKDVKEYELMLRGGYTGSMSSQFESSKKLHEIYPTQEDFDKYYKLAQFYGGYVRDKEYSEYIANSIKEGGVGSAILGNIGSIATSPLRGVNTIYNLAEGMRGGYGNPYFANDLGAFQKGVQQGTYDMLPDNELAKWLYDASYSMTESAYQMAVSSYMGNVIGGAGKVGEAISKVLGGLMFSSNAFSSSYEEAVSGGMPSSIAIKVATANGIFESLFEEISFDKLIKLKNMGKTDFKTTITNILKSSFTEGSEEVATDIADWLYEYAVAGSYSEFGKRVNELRGQGYSEEEAKSVAMTEFSKRLLKDFTIGGLSGAGHSAVIVGSNAIRKSSVASDVISEGYLEKFIEATKDSDNFNSKVIQNITNKDINDITKTDVMKILDVAMEGDNAVTDVVNEAYQYSQLPKNVKEYVNNAREYANMTPEEREHFDTEKFVNNASKVFGLNKTESKYLRSAYEEKSDDVSDSEFRSAWNLFYNNARNGYTFEDILTDSENFNVALANSLNELDHKTMQRLYNIGYNAFSKVKEVNASEKNIKTITEMFSKAGVNVEYLGTTDGGYYELGLKTANGESTGDTIYISKESSDVAVVVAGHEFVHHLARNDAKLYQSLKELSADWLRENHKEVYDKVMDNLEDLYADERPKWEKLAKERGRDVEDFIKERKEEEMVASMTEAIFQKLGSMTQKEVQEFSKELHEKDEALWKRVLNFFKDFAKNLHKMMKGYKTFNEGAKTLLGDEAQLNKFIKAYESAVVEFSERQNKTETKNETKPKSKDSSDMKSKKDNKGRILTDAQVEFYEDIDPLLRDSEGNIKTYYHGTSRRDRVGTIFRPERATSGPMAYFTDDEQIATNYSKTKADTSTAYEEEYEDYFTQFTITKPDGREVAIPKAFLTAKESALIKERAKHIGFDDDYEEIIYDENIKNGLGNWDYTLRDNHGNVLRALVDAWLQTGELLNREEDFLKVLKLAGYDKEVTYHDPYFRDEGVYEVYINAKNLLDTNEIPAKVVKALEKKSKSVVYDPMKNAQADMWDKNGITPENWLKNLHSDIENNTTYSWTIIPDWVTDTLKELGYDGISDRGGKYTGNSHQVVIPFESNQIKSVENKNPTEDSDIMKSKKDNLGRTLTTQQDDFFDKSVIRDENGNLFTMYHGADAVFTEFDVKKFGEHSGDKIGGIWTSNDKSVASQYAGKNLIECYVNIEKPISLVRKTITENDLKSLMKAMGSEFKIAFNDGNISKFAERIIRQNSNDYQIVKAFYKLTTAENREKFYNILKDTLGYDGYVLKDGVAVAFSSSQIKEVTNQNPTSNKDIMKSKKDNKGRLLTEDQEEYFKDSVITDSKGNLKVVYHGTTANFTTFKRGDIGYHFGTKSTAIDRVGRGKGTRIIEAYINITNPITFDEDLGSWDADYRLTEELVEKGIISKEEGRDVLYFKNGEYYNKWSTEKSNKNLQNLLKEKGYDGIIYKNSFEGTGGNSYIVFDSSQAKSLENEHPTENSDIMKSNKDSTGRTLSSGQIKYFENSKVRDENGNLILMYHGTDGYGFTIFDPNNSDDKISLFFTNDRTMANTYAKDKSNVYEVYINLENPYIVDAKSHKWNDIRVGLNSNKYASLIEEYVDIAHNFDEEIDYSLVVENLGDITASAEYIIEEASDLFTDEEVSRLKELASELDNAYENWNEEDFLDEDGNEMSMKQVVRDSYRKSATTRSISKYAKENGYDGVIIKNVYDNGKYYSEHGAMGFGDVVIAFDSNQVKSIYNVHPTENADIMKFKKNNDVKLATEMTQDDFVWLLQNYVEGNTNYEDNTYIPIRTNTPFLYRYIVNDYVNYEIVKDFPLASTLGHLRQNMKEDDGTYPRGHDMTITDIVNLVKKMDFPEYIVEQDNGRFAEVVSIEREIKSKNKKIYVVLSVEDENGNNHYKYSEYMNGYNSGYYNIVVTFYHPDDFKSYMKNKHIIYDKKKNDISKVGLERNILLTHYKSFFDPNNTTDLLTSQDSTKSQKHLTFTDERIDTLLDGGHFGSTAKDYAQAYITYISPEDYLHLTTGTDAYLEHLKSESHELNVEELDKYFNAQPIQLNIDEDEEITEVIGHEGRHRMIALANSGIERVPVLLFNSKNKYSKQHMDSLELMPQYFNSGQRTETITLSDIVPFSQGNAEEIKQKFGSGNTESEMMFSRKGIARSSFDRLNSGIGAENIIYEGAKLTNGHQISNSAVNKIANEILRDENSLYAFDDLKFNLNSLFKYIEQHPDANFHDMMRIAYEIAMPVVKESAFKSKDESLSERIFNLALRIYQNYYNELGKANSISTEKLDRVVNEIKDKYDAKEYRRKEREEVTKLRKAIRDKKARIDRMVKNPTKGSHIPEDMMRAVIELADAIDVTTDRMTFKAKEEIDKLKDLYDKLLGDDTYSYAHDSYTAQMISILKDIVGNKRIIDLNKSDLEKVDTIMSAILTQIKNENEFVTEKTSETIHDKAVKGTEEVKLARRLNRSDSVEGKLDRAGHKWKSTLVDFERLVRNTFYYMPDSVGDFIIDRVYEGEMKELLNLREGNDIFDGLIDGDEEVRRALLDFTGKNAKGKYDESTWVELPSYRGGKAIKVPKAFRMSIIMHLMSEDNIRHIAYGGFALPNIEDYMRGDLNSAYHVPTKFHIPFFDNEDVKQAKESAEALEKWSDDGRYRVNKANPLYQAYENARDEYDKVKNRKTISDEEKAQKKQARDDAWQTFQNAREDAYRHLDRVVNARAKEYLSLIFNDLSEYELKMLDASQKFFWNWTGDKINETSMKLKGYKIAGVTNYFPIRVDTDSIIKENENLKFDATLEGMGFLKERVSSKKPIYLEDITNVILRSLRNVSKYNGYAESLRDAKAVLKYASADMGSSLERAIRYQQGDKVFDSIEKYLNDIETSSIKDNDASKFLARLRSRMAGATLTGNVGVMIKQSASFPTAIAVLDTESVTKALKNFASKPLEEVELRSALMELRRQGFTDAELGDIKKMKASGKKFVAFTGMIQWMDIRTTTALQYASKYWVDKHTNLTEGTDEYWDAVAEKFNEVIRQTQPNYSSLERPQLLQSSSDLMRLFLMYRTQTMQNFGILFDAISEAHAMKDLNKQGLVSDEQLLASKKKMARAIGSHLSAQMTFVIFDFISKLLYHQLKPFKDDDDKWDWLNVGKYFVSSFMEAELGMIPFVAELVEAITYGGKFLFRSIKGESTSDLKYYGLSDSVVDQFNDVVSGITNVIGNVSKYIYAETDADREKYAELSGYSARKWATNLSMFFGVPVNNIYKPINSMVAYFVNGKGFWTGDVSDIKNQNSRTIDAMMSGDTEEFERLYKQIVETTNADDPEKQAYSNLSKEVHKRFLNGEITDVQAKSMLKHLKYSDDTIKGKLKDWKKELKERK